jgi:DNA repair ATPase RecN
MTVTFEQNLLALQTEIIEAAKHVKEIKHKIDQVQKTLDSLNDDYQTCHGRLTYLRQIREKAEVTLDDPIAIKLQYSSLDELNAGSLAGLNSPYTSPPIGKKATP